MATATESKRVESTRVNARETEIARRLWHVIERLPIRALQNFMRNLRDGVDETSERPEANRIRWATHVATSSPICILRDPIARVEVSPEAEGSTDRFDLVIPTPPVIIAGQLVTSITFEFKLGSYDSSQLQRYALALKNSVLLSVSKEAVGLDQIFKLDGTTPVVFQTWEHLYFALHGMLSGDAGPRVEKVDEPADLLLKFDHRLAGQDRVSFEIESFLELLISRDLLPNRDLVLVVPRGLLASETLQASPPYYRHPDSWRPGYRYLVTVYRNQIQDIFEVTNSVTTDSVDGTVPPAPNGMNPKEWEEEIAASPGSRVSVLRRLTALDPILGTYVNQKYYKPGPKGRAAAFTQTHRYVEHPEDLGNYFNPPSTTTRGP